MDTGRKIEKLEDWQEKGLNESLREEQKVYLRREEEKQKAKAKVMVPVARESRLDSRMDSREDRERGSRSREWHHVSPMRRV